MKKLAILLTACLFLTACGAAKKTAPMEKYSDVRMDLFDTVFILTGYARDEKAFHETADALFDELTELHHLFDIYHEYDGIVNLCTINRGAGGEALAVDPRIIELLTLARSFAEETGGMVDVTAGRVLQIWHQARTRSLDHPEDACLPDAKALEAASAHTGIDRLEIDPVSRTVRLTDPETLLDVGAVAKGFAVQTVCEDLPEGWLINAGGNVFASGEKPDGSDWTIGVQNPDGDASDMLCSLSIKKGAVVTSGDYQRFYTVNGVRCHHIIDLKTLFPAQKWRSVTILCEDSGIADGLSTALFVLSREEGERLLARYGAEALWVGMDGSIHITSGMEPYLVK